jgi:hypothetical protein
MPKMTREDEIDAIVSKHNRSLFDGCDEPDWVPPTEEEIDATARALVAEVFGTRRPANGTIH